MEKIDDNLKQFLKEVRGTQVLSRSEEMLLRDLDREIEEIQNEMRAVYLDRDDIRFLRDALAKLRLPHLAAQEKKAKELEEYVYQKNTI